MSVSSWPRNLCDTHRIEPCHPLSKTRNAIEQRSQCYLSQQNLLLFVPLSSSLSFSSFHLYFCFLPHLSTRYVRNIIKYCLISFVVFKWWHLLALHSFSLNKCLISLLHGPDVVLSLVKNRRRKEKKKVPPSWNLDHIMVRKTIHFKQIWQDSSILLSSLHCICTSYT